MSLEQSMILMFHSIITDTKMDGRFVKKPRFEMTVAQFTSIIEELIKRNYAFISMDELSQLLIQKKKIYRNQPFVVFTFDDGYSDLYHQALPVMEKYKVPFTVYVTTGYPDKEIIHMSEAVEDIVRHNNTVEIKVGHQSIIFDTSSLQAKKKAFVDIEQYLWSNFTTINEMAQALGVDYLNYYLYGLSWEEIKELSNNTLCTIGSHTCTHPDLTRLDRERLKKELQLSKIAIEEKLKITVNHFAYPFGRNSTIVQNEAVAAGYKTIATTAPEYIDFGRTQVHCLPRLCAEAHMYSTND